jgi:hypothetical protein
MELKILFYVMFRRYKNHRNRGTVTDGGFLTVVLSNLEKLIFLLEKGNKETYFRTRDVYRWLLYFSDVLKETGDIPATYKCAYWPLNQNELPEKYKTEEFNGSALIQKIQNSGIVGFNENVRVERIRDINEGNFLEYIN